MTTKTSLKRKKKNCNHQNYHLTLSINRAEAWGFWTTTNNQEKAKPYI